MKDIEEEGLISEEELLGISEELDERLITNKEELESHIHRILINITGQG